MVRSQIGVRPETIGIEREGHKILRVKSKIFFDSLGLVRTKENCEEIEKEMKRAIAGLNRRARG